MANEVERLAVLVEANTKSFENAMKRLEQVTDRSMRNAARSTDNLDKRLSALGNRMASLSRLAATGFFASMVKSSVDAAAKIGDVATRLGVSAEAFQEMSYAATQAGASQEAFTTGMTRMSAFLGEVARGSKTAIAELRALGLSVKDLEGLSPDQVFMRLADQISKISDPIQKNAALIKFFGRSGAELSEFMSLGASGIQRLREEAQRLGLVLSNETISKMKDAGDKIDQIKAASMVAGAKIAEALLPALDALAKLVTSEGFQQGLVETARAIGNIVKVLAENPNLAKALLGAAIGGRVGGLLGAIAGGVGGYYSTEIGGLIKDGEARRASTFSGAMAILNRSGPQAGGPQSPLFYPGSSADFSPGMTAPGAINPFAGAAAVTPKPFVYKPPPTGDGSDPMEATIKRYEEMIRQIELQTRALEQTDRQKAIDENVTRLGANATQEMKDKIAAMTAALYDAQQAQKALNDAAQFGSEILYDALDGLILKGQNFNDVLRNMVARLAEAVLQATLLGKGPLAGLFGSSPTSSGGVGGLFGTILGAFGLPGFADGGGVGGHRPVKVGEKGTEVFVPHSSGTIISNDRLAGGGQVAGTIELVLSDDIDARIQRVSGPLAVNISRQSIGRYHKSRQRGPYTGADAAGVYRG